MLVAYFLATGLLLLTLQTTLLQFWPGWAGKLDPLFVLVVFLSLRLDLIRGALVLLVFGLIMDIFSGIFLGLYPIVYLSLLMLIKLISHNLVIEDLTYQVPLVGISCLYAAAAAYFLNLVIDPQTAFPWSWRPILLQSLLSGIMAIPCFKIFGIMADRLLSRRRKRLNR